MGRKKQTDIDKDQFLARLKKRRDKLKGPFMCPKCHANSLHVYQHSEKRTYDVTRTYVGITKTFTVTKQVPVHHFLCLEDGCHFFAKEVKGPRDSLVDMYCRVYDQNITEETRTQLKVLLTVSNNPKIVRVQETTVKWK